MRYVQPYLLLFALQVGPALAETATDWSGPYAGLTAGRAPAATTTYYYSGVEGDSHLLEGSDFGGFAGFNMQRGSFVYGMEVAAQTTDFTLDNGFDSNFETMLDLKLRGGVAVGQSLAYGFVGYSAGTWDNMTGDTGPAASGPNFGLGVETQFGAKWFGGVEYIYRNTSTTFDGTATEMRAEFGTLQLRLGFRF